ncbi:MAG: zf-HC2 domain-containing protein [bacterium]
MSMPAVLKTCDEVKEFLMDFLDGRMPRLDSFKFRAHMALCPPCKRYMNRYNDSVKLAQHILDDPPPPELVNLTYEFLKKNLPKQ